MRRRALAGILVSIALIAGGAALFMAGQLLLSILLFVVGWAVLGTTIQGDMRLPPGEGPEAGEAYWPHSGGGGGDGGGAC